MLSSSSMIQPSAPLMLLTNTVAAPATGLLDLPPVTASVTTVPLPVLAPNNAVLALLKPKPLAPNGGTPLVVSLASLFQSVASPPPGPVRQIVPLNESETYTLPASSKVRTFNPAVGPLRGGIVMKSVEAPVIGFTFRTFLFPKSMMSRLEF